MPLRRLLTIELDQICDSVIQMGDRVEHAIERSIEALLEYDTELAQQVIDDDEVINALRFSIEESCFALLATQQPTASDLRMVVSALHIITDLERIGDYAKGIGQLVLRMDSQPLLLSSRTTPRMASVVREMLHEALDAFVDGDVETAQRLCEKDDTVDHMYRRTFESIIQSMITKEAKVRTGMHLLFAAHNLERIGDRVTNIGERVVFMVTGTMEERNW